jgi:hypothetical protein
MLILSQLQMMPDCTEKFLNHIECLLNLLIAENNNEINI